MFRAVFSAGRGRPWPGVCSQGKVMPVPQGNSPSLWQGSLCQGLALAHLTFQVYVSRK